MNFPVKIFEFSEDFSAASRVTSAAQWADQNVLQGQAHSKRGAWPEQSGCGLAAYRCNSV